MKLQTLPQTPEELLEILIAIFPRYQEFCKESDGYDPTYHSILRRFTNFFGKEHELFSEKQLSMFGRLVSEAVAQPGELENALATCFLEHLNQIGAARVLNPYLSKLAKDKSHA